MPRTITLEELKKNNTIESMWIAVHDKVYDVTKFVDSHPGGEQVLLESSGNYATDVFEDVGHSTDARELMNDLYLGDLAEGDHEKNKSKGSTPDGTVTDSSSWISWLVPLGIAVVAAFLYRYFTSTTPVATAA